MVGRVGGGGRACLCRACPGSTEWCRRRRPACWRGGSSAGPPAPSAVLCPRAVACTAKGRAILFLGKIKGLHRNTGKQNNFYRFYIFTKFRSIYCDRTKNLKLLSPKGVKKQSMYTTITVCKSQILYIIRIFNISLL